MMTLRELAERIAARLHAAANAGRVESWFPATAQEVERALARAAEAAAKTRAVDDLTRALGELDQLEGEIDGQTYAAHRAADFDMADDAELAIILTARDERRLNRAIRLITGALRVLQKDDMGASDNLTMEKG
jgi:hypothetical protein